MTKIEKTALFPGNALGAASLEFHSAGPFSGLAIRLAVGSKAIEALVLMTAEDLARLVPPRQYGSADDEPDPANRPVSVKPSRKAAPKATGNKKAIWRKYTAKSRAKKAAASGATVNRVCEILTKGGWSEAEAATIVREWGVQIRESTAKPVRKAPEPAPEPPKKKAVVQAKAPVIHRKPKAEAAPAPVSVAAPVIQPEPVTVLKGESGQGVAARAVEAPAPKPEPVVVLDEGLPLVVVDEREGTTSTVPVKSFPETERSAEERRARAVAAREKLAALRAARGEK